jgi:hypothetical protein
MDARQISMTVCNDGSWSGTRSDDMSLQSGTFELPDEVAWIDGLDESLTGWACWLPAMDDTPSRHPRDE